MTHCMRLQDALLVIAAGALVIVVGVLVALSLEAASTAGWRRSAQAFDRKLVRAATLAAMPSRMPSRSATGLGLVAAGALLVLLGEGATRLRRRSAARHRARGTELPAARAERGVEPQGSSTR